MTATMVIAHYEALSALTRQMREAAIAGEWDRLIDLEQESRNLLTLLKPLDAAVQLNTATRLRKDELITAILADDTHTQSLIKIWMKQFKQTMQSTSQEMRLLKKYSA